MNTNKFDIHYTTSLFFEVYPFRIEHQYLYYIYIQINNLKVFYEKQKNASYQSRGFFFLYLVFELWVVKTTIIQILPH